MPYVSVVTPTYNRVEMVCESIDSVLDQTFRDFEIIVVDDGSTDGTGSLLHQRYGDRIRYHYQRNQGRAVARNRGIRASRGEYLVFLDSDDWLLPRALEIQVGFFDSRPEVDVVYGDGYYCDEGGTPFQLISEERPLVPDGELLAIMVLHNVIVATHSAMVRRRALDVLGDPWFDEGLRGPEDADMWLRLAAAGLSFASHDQPVCRYRLHGENTTLRSHPQWGRHWCSVQRFKRRVLEADFFPELPLATRREFLRQLLLVFFDDHPEAQETIVRSDPFQALPVSERAALLRYLGVKTVTNHRDLPCGRAWLRQAIRLAPSLRSQMALMLSYPGGWPLSWARGLRRRLERRGPDTSLAPHWQDGGKG